MGWFDAQVPPAWLALPDNKDCAGRTFYHLSEIFEEIKDQANYKTNDGAIYTFNSLGYREQEIAEDYSTYDHLILAIGNSGCFGAGVAESETYVRLVERSLTNTRVLNFGIPGASMDTLARMTACTVPYFKNRCKRLSVLMLWTQKERREVFLENYQQSWNVSQPPPFPEFVFMIDSISDKHNYEKNCVMIEAICAQHSVDLYIAPYEIYEEAMRSDVEKASDGMNPSPKYHAKIAKAVLENIK